MGIYCRACLAEQAASQSLSSSAGSCFRSLGACRGHYPFSLPLSQTLLPGPIRKLSQQGIYGKLLMTGGNRSVYAWIIYIIHNSLYFICILTGYCQRYLKKPQAEGKRMVPEVGIEPTCPCERRILSPLN